MEEERGNLRRVDWEIGDGEGQSGEGPPPPIFPTAAPNRDSDASPAMIGWGKRRSTWGDGRDI